MPKILKIFRIMSCLLILATSCTSAQIVYSPEEIQDHKQRCIQAMRTNPANYQDSTYQMQRAIKTILGTDADYIPKVAGAGEIFNDGAGSYQLMHNGIKIWLHSYYDVQWLTDVMHGLKGHHEPQEEKCFYEVLKYMPDNATMIELGSYWGYYSLWFAFDVKNPRNYLIEPDPRRVEIGKKNFELNNKTGVFKRGFAGTMHDGDPDITGAEWISIDDFLTQEGIEHINILHADIQGGEVEMLETTIRHLDSIDYFFISTHNTDALCLNFFKKHGFIILAQHTCAESCSGDGLIVAKRNGVAGPDYISIRKY